MTPEQREELKQAAMKADQDGQHIYTNPRDSNNWRNNDAFNAAASPAVVLSLIAQVEALTVPQDPVTYTADGIVMSPLEYIEYMHRQYAGERLRADQGWERYESANRDRNALRAAMAAPTIPAIPGTKEGA